MIPIVGPKVLAELDLPEMAINDEETFDWNFHDEQIPFDAYEPGAEDLNAPPQTMAVGGMSSENYTTSNADRSSSEVSETEGHRRDQIRDSQRQSDKSRETENASRSAEERTSGTEKTDDISGKTATEGTKSAKLQQALRAAQRAQKAAMNGRIEQADAEDALRKVEGARSGKTRGSEGMKKAENGTDAIRLAQAAQRIRAGQASAADRMAPAAQAIAKAARALMNQVKEGLVTTTGVTDALNTATMTEATTLANTNKTQQISPMKAPVETVSTAEFNEWVRLIRSQESGDTVLRLQDSEAGSLEVRVRIDGQDLYVALRADDLAMRDRMLENFPELQRQLSEEGVVDGNVHVGEFGTSNDGEQNAAQEQSNPAEPHRMPNAGKPIPASQNLSFTQEGTQDLSLEPGRLHIVA